jgi:hypothetical protein
MSKAQRDDDARSNRLLGALDAASRKRIDPHLEPTKLKLGAIVCEAGGLLKHAYFPQGTVLSLLTVLENGSPIEVHTSLLNMVLHDKPEIEMRDEPIGAEQILQCEAI